jgi:ElaB/YqjD/DUF883 family membrane-anchored ribosome-binding protein
MMAEIEVRRPAPIVEHTGFRLSWGAVFAGFIVATMIQIALSLLGVAVGFTTWDMGDPAGDLGMGLGIWIAVSALIALFVGGLTTGRLAGVLTKSDGALHGIVMWGVASLVNIWLLMSGAGFLLGGAFDILGRAVSAGAGAAVSGATALGSAALGDSEIDPAGIRAEIEAMLDESGSPALSSDTLQADVERIGSSATEQGVSNDDLASEIWNSIQSRAGEVDRDAIVSIVTARTDLSESEADRLATRLEDLAERTGEQIGETADTIGSTAVDVADDATDYAGQAAWWALLAMLLGAGAAAWGATVKARD